jgi:hypothetical protein
MLFKKIISVCSENYMKRVQLMCTEQNYLLLKQVVRIVTTTLYRTNVKLPEHLLTVQNKLNLNYFTTKALKEISIMLHSVFSPRLITLWNKYVENCYPFQLILNRCIC